MVEENGDEAAQESSCSNNNVDSGNDRSDACDEACEEDIQGEVKED